MEFGRSSSCKRAFTAIALTLALFTLIAPLATTVESAAADDGTLAAGATVTADSGERRGSSLRSPHTAVAERARRAFIGRYDLQGPVNLARNNSITVTSRDVSLKTDSVKNGAKAVSPFMATNASGSVTFEDAGSSTGLSVMPSGKVKVAKGTPAGMYTAKAVARAAGGNRHKKGSKAVEAKVQVLSPPPAPNPAFFKAKARPAGFEASWRKVERASGYEVLYTRAKEGAHRCFVADTLGDVNTRAVSGLSAKTAYTVCIRAYVKAVDGAKYYSGRCGRVIVRTLAAARVDASVPSCSWDRYQYVDGETTPKSIALSGHATRSGNEPDGFILYRKGPGDKTFKKHGVIAKSGWDMEYTDRAVTYPNAYEYKFRAYRAVGGKTLLGALSGTVKMRAVNRTGSLEFSYLTKRGVTTDHLDIKISSAKGNGKIVIPDGVHLYHVNDVGIYGMDEADVTLAVSAVSSNGSTWKKARGEATIAAGQTRFVRLSPVSRDDWKTGKTVEVKTFKLAPANQTTVLLENVTYNGFHAIISTSLYSSEATVRVDGERYH